MPKTTTATEGTTASRFLTGEGLEYLTDGGLETTLVFHRGIELADFAAFPLLDDKRGREQLASYFRPYLDIAEREGLGMVLDTPTWRANPDWASRLGYDGEQLVEVNRRAVSFVEAIADDRPNLDTVKNGVVGPRGDGYLVGEAMSVAEAANYHSLQIRALADAGVDTITAVTMTYADEAIGIANAAEQAGVPAIIGFTVETDGRLPSGMALAEALTAVDEATGAGPAWYMVNCAHPSHFAAVLDGPWLSRVKAIRANASRMSHAELDEAPELDRGDIDDLAADYVGLRAKLAGLRVVGGCCGTDHEHIAAIASAVTKR